MPAYEIQCGICRRNLMTGERAFAFADSRSGASVTVCPLCVGKAEQNAWERLEDPPPVPVETEDTGRTVRLLQAQVTTLQHQLKETMGSLEGTRDETVEKVSELDALAARLADAEAEGAVVRVALAEAERSLAQLAEEGEELRKAQAAILRARRREADEAYLAGIAAEVFNRSPQAATIGLLVELHGAPLIRIDVLGISLPRQARIDFAWPNGGRDYRVDIDLVARQFELVDLVPGGDGRLLPREELIVGNAAWQEGRVVTAPVEPTQS